MATRRFYWRRRLEYKPQYCQDVIEFFLNHKLTYERTVVEGENYKKTEIVPNEFPTLSDFAKSIVVDSTKKGVSRQAVYTWRKRFPEFDEACRIGLEIQNEILMKGAIMGVFSPGFSVFAMKNMSNWRDKTEVEHSGEIALSIAEKLKNIRTNYERISAN